MKNFPKFINNRYDLDVCAQEYPQETKARLQDILDYKDIWIATGLLADGDAGITDETHKVDEIKDAQTQTVTQRYQLEFMEDPSPNGPIKRYDFVNGAEMKAYMEAI